MNPWPSGPWPNDDPRWDELAESLGPKLVRRRERAPGEPEPRWWRAPADVRVRWHRPTRYWFIDQPHDDRYLTIIGTPAYRSQHDAMTHARLLAVERQEREALALARQEQPC